MGMDEIARAALDELNRAMRERDADVAGLFLPDAVLVGSEPGEVARGQAAIGALLLAIHAKDYTVWWDMPQLDAGGDEGKAWFFADGEVVLVAQTGARRLPYRISGVLVDTEAGWRWALFHGSEPRT
jgi:hypothetical protein